MSTLPNFFKMPESNNNNKTSAIPNEYSSRTKILTDEDLTDLKIALNTMTIDELIEKM